MGRDSTRPLSGTRKVRLTIVGAVTLSLLVIPVSARAATLTLSLSIAEPGDSIEAAGSGYEDEAMVKLCLDNENCASLGQVTTDDDGSFATTVQLPDDISAGSHEITACAQGDELVCSSASLTIEVGTTTTTSTTTTTTTTTTTAPTTTTTTTTTPTTTAPTTTTTTASTTTTATAPATSATTGPTTSAPTDPGTTTTAPPSQATGSNDPATEQSAPNTAGAETSTTTTAPLVLGPTTTQPTAHLPTLPDVGSASFEFYNPTPDVETIQTAEVLANEVLPGEDASPPPPAETANDWLTLGGILAAMTFLVAWVVRYLVHEMRQ